jgi:polysaccharide biosynthesis/export protein VpsN
MLQLWKSGRRQDLVLPTGRSLGLGRGLIGSWLFVLFCFVDFNPAVGQDDYTLGTGDRLRITVFGHQDLSGEFQVDSSGRVTLPLIGDLPVIRRTLQDVEDQIIAKLKPNYLRNPQVSVEIISYRNIYVLGEVANPGPYPYVGRMTVITAVALAGGFTYRAVKDEFVISRDGQKIDAAPHTLILPGDVIDVDERFF